jgi:HPt (histidine-containing phosphotransfer) domain-containing protein
MIDKTRALNDFQITEKDFDEMLVEFVTQANDNIRNLKKELFEGNVEAAERFAHSLKGVAGNMRLDNCYRVASDVDAALKKGPPVSIDPLLDDLEKAVDEVRSSIRT